MSVPRGSRAIVGGSLACTIGRTHPKPSTHITTPTQANTRARTRTHRYTPLTHARARSLSHASTHAGELTTLGFCSLLLFLIQHVDVDELIAETLDFDSSELDELLESIHMVRSREFQSFITYPYKVNTNRANTHIREVPSMNTTCMPGFVPCYDDILRVQHLPRTEVQKCTTTSP